MAAIALLLVLSGVATVLGPNATAFHNAFVADGFSRFAKLLILGGAGFSILLADEFFAPIKLSRFELPVLMLLATLGMMLMVSASSFLSLYMGLELQSLALYVLAAFNRDHLRSTEAGLKYFVLGALSSGMMLYGISLIYGFAGTNRFCRYCRCDACRPPGLGVIFGTRLFDREPRLQGLRRALPYVDAGCCMKDAPHSGHRLFCPAAKAAALCLFPARHSRRRSRPCCINGARSSSSSVLSMALGAIAAIGQTNIKRLMAYSAIGNMGYALIGLAAGTTHRRPGVLIYLAGLCRHQSGVFAGIQAMRRGPSVKHCRPGRRCAH